MKCWKCGKELSDGTTICVYCNTSQRRTAPKTETGRAMRMVYDRFGCDRVLAEKAYLTNALGDVLPDSQKLRSQLSVALDAGAGREYLTQLKTSGRLDEAFRSRVRKLLIEEAELSDRRAAEIMDFFDEMIGWELPRVGNPGGGNSPGVTKPTGEIPRPGGWSPPGRPQPETEAEAQSQPKSTQKNNMPRALAFGVGAFLVWMVIMTFEGGSVNFKGETLFGTMSLCTVFGAISFYFGLRGKQSKAAKYYFWGAVIFTVVFALDAIGIIF